MTAETPVTPDPAVPTGRITDERPAERPSPQITPRQMAVYTLGGVALFCLAFWLLDGCSSGGRAADAPPPSEDILAQQAYDQRQAERARRKAESLADEAFVDRTAERPFAPSPELLRKLAAREEASSAEVPVEESAARRRRQSLVEQILEKKNSQGNDASSRPPRYLYQSQREAQSVSQSREKEREAQRQPMFAYSRRFRQAAYYDEPVADTPPAPAASATYDEIMRHELAALAAEQAPAATNSESSRSTPSDEGPTTVYYSALPPVTLHEGEFVEAVLTHRLQADVEECPVVCTVVRDLYDNSGRYVIIPTGTRVVGRSAAVSYQGAARLFIALHRMILPNGVSVPFPNSKQRMLALDQTGVLGAATRVNRHWWLQFGTAVFVGVLNGLGAAAQQRVDPYSARAYVVEDTTDNFERILNTIMQRYTTIVPTITVAQGYPLKIHIAEDVRITPYALTRERSYVQTQ